LVKEQRLDGLTTLVRILGATYRELGEQMEAAGWARKKNVVTWHRIHVLEKLEKDMLDPPPGT
jgi:hypothetical protein